MRPAFGLRTAEAGEGAASAITSLDVHLDFERSVCILCQRQLKDAEQLRKHAAKSELHMKNLKIWEVKQLEKQRRMTASLQLKQKASSSYGSAKGGAEYGGRHGVCFVGTHPCAHAPGECTATAAGG